MKRFLRKISMLTVVFVMISLPLSMAIASSKPGQGVTVRSSYAGVAQTLFQLKIVLAGLKELGYKIAPVMDLEMVTMHVAVAQGDADILTNHWDPIHNHIYKKIGGAKKVTKVGVIIENALQGYLIDKKTADKYQIKSIDQLTDPKIAKLFDANGNGKADLVGCNPGWGCERVIEHHLDAYKLRDTVEHIQGAYFALMADSIARFKQKEPVLYYTWTPQWLSGTLVPGKDVEWLTVPFTALPKDQKGANTSLPDGRNVGHSVVKVWVLANNDFLKANPAAKKFMELVKIPIDNINTQNLMMKKGEDEPADIDRHVSDWIAENQSLFDNWVAIAAE